MHTLDGRVLGLDVGTHRIGVAISDAGQLIARELNVIQVTSRLQAVERIVKIIKEFDVVKVVIGLPLTLRGDEGEQARITRLLGTALTDATQVPVEYLDERFTSKLSDHTMRELNVSSRSRKGKRDMLSALFILQLYLDSQHRE